MQQFRAPDTFYLQQNQFQLSPVIDISRITFSTIPNINIQPIQQYSPIFNSMSNGSRTYQYVPVAPANYYLQRSLSSMQQFRAPDNYYKSPAATMPSYSPSSFNSGFSNWP
jgi:hypothetical protein